MQPRAVEKEQRDAWVPARRRTWPGRLHCAGDLHSGGGEKQSKQAGWRWKRGPKRYFQKFQGPHCKIAITFKLRLK